MMSIKQADTQPKKETKIPRPMNAFMIFAREHRPKVKMQFPKEENHIISVRLGKMWANMETQSKDYYHRLSREVANQHRQKYPDYRYEPKPKLKKKRRYDQYLQMDRMRTAAADAAKEKSKQNVAVGNQQAQKTPTVNSSVQANIPHQQSPVPNRVGQPQVYSCTEMSHTYYGPPPTNPAPAHSGATKTVIFQGGYVPQTIPPSYPHYSAHYAPVYSVDQQYANEPLDMSKVATSRDVQYITENVTSSGKVYCDLSAPQKPKSTFVLPELSHFAVPSTTVAYQTYWEPNRHPPAGGQSAENSVSTQMQRVVFTQPPTNSSTAGDQKTTELVWIPCEPEFARKMGWPLDSNTTTSGH